MRWLLGLSIICLTGIEGYALYQGIDGVALAAFMVAMGAVSGYTSKEVLARAKKLLGKSTVGS